ncbi:MAG: hypothetical protein ACR2JQ_00845 [Mycobacteriales bacterium]
MGVVERQISNRPVDEAAIDGARVLVPLVRERAPQLSAEPDARRHR